MLMNLKGRSFEIFGQPSFLAPLLVLVTNDLYLKAEYHNWLTGKLSDFAGLYIFVLFVAAVSGIRIVWVAIASAGLFIAWKSPAATPLIEFVNSYSPLQVHRTIDYTDLAALIVLPLAVRLYTAKAILRWGILKYPSAVIAMLAIMATSVIPRSYNVRFDLQNLPNREATVTTTYAQVDRLLTERGMRCVACAAESPYREYFDPQGSITAQLHYDSIDRKLYISLHTSLPDVAKARTDELQTKLMEQLHPRFENITVTRTASKYEATTRTTRELKIEVPPVGFPLSCTGNGRNHPEIAKAMAVVDDVTNMPSAIDLGSRSCFPTDARCSLAMCRHTALGRVIGASRSDRSIHVSTRGYVGWGGTSLYVEITEYGDALGQDTEFKGNLERRLRAGLGKEVSITVVRPGAQTGVPGALRQNADEGS